MRETNQKSGRINSIANVVVAVFNLLGFLSNVIHSTGNEGGLSKKNIGTIILSLVFFVVFTATTWALLQVLLFNYLILYFNVLIALLILTGFNFVLWSITLYGVLKFKNLLS